MALRTRFSRERARKRWRALWRGVLGLAILGGLTAIGYSSYRAGSVLARMEVTALQGKVDHLSDLLDAARAENDGLRTDLAQARQTADAMKRRYDSDVPKGALATLGALIQQRLRDGVQQERIAQVLRSVEATRPCEAVGTRKRFAIQLPGQGKEGVSLLDGMIQVSASAPVVAEDPAKVAAVTITRAWEPQPIKVTGMPVRQSVTINNAELRLVVEASNLPGYATVSLSTCGNG